MPKTETIAIKVSPEEKAIIQTLAAQQGSTVSKILYKIVFEDNEGVNALMREELKHYTNWDLEKVSNRKVQEAYKLLFKGEEQ